MSGQTKRVPKRAQINEKEYECSPELAAAHTASAPQYPGFTPEQLEARRLKQDAWRLSLKVRSLRDLQKARLVLAGLQEEFENLAEEVEAVGATDGEPLQVAVEDFSVQRYLQNEIGCLVLTGEPLDKYLRTVGHGSRDAFKKKCDRIYKKAVEAFPDLVENDVRHKQKARIRNGRLKAAQEMFGEIQSTKMSE